MKKNNDLSVVNIDEVEMIETTESVNIEYAVSENDSGKNEEHFHCILCGSMFHSENNLLETNK